MKKTIMILLLLFFAINIYSQNIETLDNYQLYDQYRIHLGIGKALMIPGSILTFGTLAGSVPYYIFCMMKPENFITVLTVLSSTFLSVGLVFEIIAIVNIVKAKKLADRWDKLNNLKISLNYQRKEAMISYIIKW